MTVWKSICFINPTVWKQPMRATSRQFTPLGLATFCAPYSVISKVVFNAQFGMFESRISIFASPLKVNHRLATEPQSPTPTSLRLFHRKQWLTSLRTHSWVPLGHLPCGGGGSVPPTWSIRCVDSFGFGLGFRVRVLLYGVDVMTSGILDQYWGHVSY